MDISIHISCPDILAAASTLASALIEASRRVTPCGVPGAPVQPTHPTTQMPIGPVAPATPVTEAPAPYGDLIRPGDAAPAQAAAATPTTAIPTAKPAYTLEQIRLAGGALMPDATKRPQLAALMQRYGIKTVGDLPTGQYDAFAADLRAIGAQI